MAMIKQSIHIEQKSISNFRNEVIEQKSALNTQDKARNLPTTQRSMESDIIFERVNLFVQRLNDVLEMISAANDLFTLEMIEIGGIRGRSLNKKVAAILGQFQLIYNACKTNYTNLLEPQNPEFDVLKASYSAKVALLERKLAQIFVEAFESCNSIESGMKLSEMIGELLSRPIIQQRMVEKTKAIIGCIYNDIETIQSLLDECQVNKGSLVNQTVWLIFNGFTLLTQYPFFLLCHISFSSPDQSNICRFFGTTCPQQTT